MLPRATIPSIATRLNRATRRRRGEASCCASKQNRPALTMDWASALRDLMPSASATVDPVVPADSTVLLKRAKSLLAEGDIAGARLILEHLAELGKAMPLTSSREPTTKAC